MGCLHVNRGSLDRTEPRLVNVKGITTDIYNSSPQLLSIKYVSLLLLRTFYFVSSTFYQQGLKFQPKKRKCQILLEAQVLGLSLLGLISYFTSINQQKC